MDYLIGDLQGCCQPLDRLLAQVDFSASRDHIYLLGDLVNRGPDSLATLRRLRALDASASCLLGNHDLHLLAVAHGVRPPSRGDTLEDVLTSPDCPALMDWLRRQRLAIFERGWLMLHAGVVPQWDLATTLALAAGVEASLRGADPTDFLRAMYGNEPSRWDPALSGDALLRFTVNVLTRIRYCTADGALDLQHKEAAEAAPEGVHPWFDVPNRLTRDLPIAFGHWSTLGLVNRPTLLCLDTGCVWGGRLTAVRLAPGGEREVIQIDCPRAQRPG
jgi:bis(5'-nucleosyl)-tetraphosphatase (symmetrical)